MVKKTKNIFLIFLIAIFIYSIMQCLIPTVYFDLDKDNLNVKLSKFCNEIFEKDFDVVVTYIDNKSDIKTKIYFKNNLQGESSGEAVLIKTIFNRYSMTEMYYVDKNINFHHESPLENSYFTIISSLFICLILLFILIKNR